MTNIRCLIVDDEPVAQRIITNYIGDVPDMEVAAACHNAIEATMILQQQKIDLMFLDIEMPKIKGVEFAKSLKHPPAIIFTTAHREFALDGFDLGVIDYLLKPISFQRFFQAVAKYRDTQQVIYTSPAEAPTLLSFKSDRKTYRVHASEIQFVEGMGNYVQLSLNNKKLVVYEKLSTLIEKLPDHFLRIHKSYIINTQSITAFTSEFIEIGNKQIPIGGSYKKQVLVFLEHS